MDPKREYEMCLAQGLPYFGSHMRAFQGIAARHIYMRELVERECRASTDKAYTVLEIGSWAGGSAITWGDAIKRLKGAKGRVFCVDPWHPYIDAEKYSDFEGQAADVYREMESALNEKKILSLFLHNIKSAGLEGTVIPVVGTIEDFTFIARDPCIDLIYVDGNHTYEHVKEDLSTSSELLKVGGIICGDDLELQHPAFDRQHAWENRGTDFILDPATKQRFHPGVALAVGEFFGQVSCMEGFWAMRKTHSGWEKVTLSVPQNRMHLPTHLAAFSPPQLVAQNIWGFNILSYRQNYYGIAQSIGAIDLSTLSDEALSQLCKQRQCIQAETVECVVQSIVATIPQASRSPQNSTSGFACA